MLDIKYIREHSEFIQQCANNKNFDVDVNALLKVDEHRRDLLKTIETKKAQQNNLSKSINKASPEERPKIIEEANALKQEITKLNPELEQTLNEYEQRMLSIPNICREDVPIGKSDEENTVLRIEGKPRTFSFEPKDHETLCDILDLADFERGAKVSGNKQYYLKNEGALLELAILRMAVDMLLDRNYQLMLPPVMVQPEAMFGTGWFPGGEDQAYEIPRDGMFLIGTSEVPLCAYHSDEILAEEELPKRYIGYSNCFRREAGTYGKDTRGLYRIHQFQKVEQVIVCKNEIEESDRFHNEILGNAEKVVQALELPYQVVTVCSGDLGLGQVYKNDIESYMYSREGYCETHSCSTFYEFQARRLGIRYRDSHGKTQFCHTLNNTTIASPRVLISFLEHHQNEDGSVTIPKALQPYMRGMQKIEPKN